MTIDVERDGERPGVGRLTSPISSAVLTLLQMSAKRHCRSRGRSPPVTQLQHNSSPKAKLRVLMTAVM